ncbi:MAG: hypothetical protein LC799_10100 [Actinobacteria bacterium]|nr:hypothetical protein [Actinomycetota bacterium]
MSTMHRGDGNGMGGLDHSIRPGTPVPATMLVVAMNDGSYLLVGHPQGEPACYVIAEDAVPLRQVLATAFGSEQPAGNGVATAGCDPEPATATQP